MALLAPDDKSQTEWVTVPELVDILGVGVTKVRRLMEDRNLIGVRIDGVLKVPLSFIRDREPLPELRGTLILLGDCGFSDEEAMHWLLTRDDTLGASPIEALRSGRKAEVRRTAQALGF